MLASFALYAVAGTVRLSDASRAYVRRSLVSDLTTLDLENSPRLDGQLAWPTLQLEIDYAPRYTLLDVLGSEPITDLWLHEAAARLSLRRPRYVLSLSQTGALGERDFTVLSPRLELSGSEPDMQTEVELLPMTRVVRVAEEETSANLTYLWTRRWRSEFGAALGFSGGADDAAQQLVAQQRHAQLDAALEFDASRRSRIGSGLTGAQIWTSSGYEYWLASLLETWSERWAPNSESALSVGAGMQDTTTPEGRRSVDWGPIALASLSYTLPTRDVGTRLVWVVGYGPDVNVIGVLQHRLYATSEATLTHDRLSLGLLLAAAQTLPADAPDAAYVASASLALRYALLEWLSAELGGQVTRQRALRASAVESPWAVWMLYAGLIAHAPEVRF
jgi:hypothetical protein